MKKINVLTAILAVLLLSFFVTSRLHASEPGTAGDKWKLISYTGATTINEGAIKLGFNIKIKNIGNVKSTGERITIKINITYNGQNLDGQELELTPSKIAKGKTTKLSVFCTNENFKQFTNTKGNKTISVSVKSITDNIDPDIITKSFTIKVK
jgi:hypothetical protein